MLVLPQTVIDDIVEFAISAYPYEACGLLSGPGGGNEAVRFHRCRNAAGSARVYTVDPLDHLRAERDAEAAGHEIIGVVHSHTHTPAYPSPTDIRQAPDRTWHYAIVSLQDDTAPLLRSFRIDGDDVSEEPVRVAAPDAPTP